MLWIAPSEKDTDNAAQAMPPAHILSQTPVQASGREHLRELLNQACGGVVLTTIQKFSGRVGVPPGRTSGDAREATPQDASLGGRDAHPTREDDVAISES